MQAREKLLAEQEASATIPSKAAEFAGRKPSEKQLFSREFQPLINSKFAKFDDDSSHQLKSSFRSRILNVLVACDISASKLCHCTHQRLKIREEIVLDKRFDIFILIVIAANAICLAADSPLLDADSRSARALRIFDVIFTIIFIVEATLKIVALVCISAAPSSVIFSPSFRCRGVSHAMTQTQPLQTSRWDNLVRAIRDHPLSNVHLWLLHRFSRQSPSAWEQF